MGHHLDETLGVLTITVFIAIFMAGIVSLQVVVYFRHFGQDPTSIKAIVGIIWLLEMAFVCSECAGMYTILVTSYENTPSPGHVPAPWVVSIFIADHLDHIVQAVLIYRLYRFCRHLWIAILLWSLAFLCYIFTLVIAVRTIGDPTIASAHTGDREWFFNALFVADTLVDVATAAILCYYFVKKGRGAIDKMQHVLNRLGGYAIQSGVFTSSVSVAALLTFNLMPHNFVWMAFYISMPGFFSNALLASFNNRLVLGPEVSRRRSTSTEDSFVALPHAEFGSSFTMSNALEESGVLGCIFEAHEDLTRVESSTEGSVNQTTRCNSKRALPPRSSSQSFKLHGVPKFWVVPSPPGSEFRRFPGQ